MDEEIAEPFKSEAEEFSADEQEEDENILAEEGGNQDDYEADLPPPIEDELMSNPLMSDLSSLNPPPSNSISQTQHKSLFDRKTIIWLLVLICLCFSPIIFGPS